MQPSWFARRLVTPGQWLVPNNQRGDERDNGQCASYKRTPVLGRPQSRSRTPDPRRSPADYDRFQHDVLLFGGGWPTAATHGQHLPALIVPAVKWGARIFGSRRALRHD